MENHHYSWVNPFAIAMLNYRRVISGWWFQPTPLKNMSSSNGMIIPNIWGKNKRVPNHQPDTGFPEIGDTPSYGWFILVYNGQILLAWMIWGVPQC